MARELRTTAEHDRLRAAADLDRVVGDQAMAAPDQVERALALADAALADQQHAEAEDVEQHAVDDLADGQAVLEQGRELADGGRRRHRRADHRQVRRVGRGDDVVGNGGAGR